MSQSSDSIRKQALEKALDQEEFIPLGLVLALVSIGRFNLLHFLLKSMLEKKLQPGAIREILLQSHLFAGFPRAINGLTLFAELVDELRIDIATADESPEAGDRRSRGRALFSRVYGNNAEAVLESLHSLHPDYDKWILEDAYGRVLARPHLAGKTRELCAVAALTACGVRKQLCSHILGAVNLGASPEEVASSIRSVGAVVDEKKIDDALEILASLDLK
jgi:4-carboxymuconolactone decarboxylase